MTIEDLQAEMTKLQEILNSLRNDTTIPKEIGDAFTARVSKKSGAFGSSSTSAASQTQAVAESGAASYNVAKPMTGFITITFNGLVYNLPYY